MPWRGTEAMYHNRASQKSGWKLNINNAIHNIKLYILRNHFRGPLQNVSKKKKRKKVVEFWSVLFCEQSGYISPCEYDVFTGCSITSWTSYGAVLFSYFKFIEAPTLIEIVFVEVFVHKWSDLVKEVIVNWKIQYTTIDDELLTTW